MPRVLPSLSLLAFCAAAPAMADVTADELWAELQGLYSAQGQTLSVESSERAGERLILRGMVTSLDQDGVQTSTRLDEMVLTENGDGTVTITVSDLMRLETSFSDPDSGDMVDMAFDLRTEGLETVVSGTPEARQYDYTADLISVSDAEITGGSAPVEMDLLMNMRDTVGQYVLDTTNPENLSLTGNATTGSLAMGISFEPLPPDEGQGKVTMMLADLSVSMDADLGDLEQAAANPDAFPPGMVIDMELSVSAAAMSVDGEDGETDFAGTYSNTGGSMALELSEQAFNFSYAETGVEAGLTSSDMPFPVEFALDGLEMVMELPVEALAEPTPFAGRVAVQNLTVSETLLSMFDPSQAIARDPITLIVDMSGAAQMFVNLLSIDPENPDEAPGELRALTINELRLSAGGAELTGTGDMTFAPDQMIPMPVGNIDLSMTGGNALIDSLVATGLVPAEQLMMVRAMTGMFARPGPTPDSLESSIVFGADGTISANGIPLQ